MDESHLLVYGLAGLAFIYLALKFTIATSPNLNHIPTIGPSGWLSSYLGAIRFFSHSSEMVQEGFTKYPNGMFKIARIDKWIVYCCGPQLLEDIQKASHDDLNNHESFEEELQMTYTMGPEINEDPYHIPIIRYTLTRNLGACFPEIHDEVVQSFDDLLSLEGNEWKAIPAYKMALSIIARASNRVFVGLPLCRNPDYLDLTTQFTIDVMTIASIIHLFPAFLRPIVGKCITKLPAHIKRGIKHLAPILEERMRKEEQYGKDWPDKPNDGLTWLLEEAEGRRRTLRDLVLRVFAVNLAAIHTSSQSFTHALYYLAANPEYATSLREEVEPILEEEGWTKVAMTRMIKVDSFLKESQRLNGIGHNTMGRRVVKDFTFSNGTVLPAGSFITVPAYATHRNETKYTSPDTFEPYRFANSRTELDGGEGVDVKRQMVTPSADFLPWGLGKRSCPGRFFATIELKAMLAHILVSYDIKTKTEGVRPSNEWLAEYCVPNRNAEVLFGRRAGREGLCK